MRKRVSPQANASIDASVSRPATHPMVESFFMRASLALFVFGLMLPRSHGIVSLDHLVGAKKDLRRYRQAQRGRRALVDRDVSLGRLLERDLGRLRAAQH